MSAEGQCRTCVLRFSVILSTVPRSGSSAASDSLQRRPVTLCLLIKIEAPAAVLLLTKHREMMQLSAIISKPVALRVR